MFSGCYKIREWVQLEKERSPTLSHVAGAEFAGSARAVRNSPVIPPGRSPSSQSPPKRWPLTGHRGNALQGPISQARQQSALPAACTQVKPTRSKMQDEKRSGVPPFCGLIAWLPGWNKMEERLFFFFFLQRQLRADVTEETTYWEKKWCWRSISHKITNMKWNMRNIDNVYTFL